MGRSARRGSVPRARRQGGGSTRGLAALRAALPALLALTALTGLAGLAGLHPREAEAQPVLYNNYNHLPTGDAAALQGGAFIARANDASASWYNPAGLVRSGHDAISGNASLYSANRLTFNGSDADTEYATTPTFIGSLTRTLDGERATSAWGFSIITPLDVQSASKRSFRQTYDIGAGPPASNVNTVLTDSSKAVLFAPGVAWSRALGDNASIGYGVRLYQLNLEVQTSSIFFEDPASPVYDFQAVENIAFAMEATLARFEAGWQWRPGASLRLGAVLRSPTASLHSRGRVLTNFLEHFVVGGNVVSAFASADEDNVDTVYRLPLELGLGAAWVRPDWEVELDAIYYRQLNPYHMVAPIDVLVISQIGTGSPTSSTVQQPGVTVTGRSFVNVALGGRVRVGESTWLNLGAYTDRAPDRFTGDEAINRVDFTGTTLGITRERSGSTASLGVVYLTGRSNEPFLATPSIVPTPGRNVTVRYQELSFVLAGSLFF
jgi:hypothetical protein